MCNCGSLCYQVCHLLSVTSPTGIPTAKLIHYKKWKSKRLFRNATHSSRGLFTTPFTRPQLAQAHSNIAFFSDLEVSLGQQTACLRNIHDIESSGQVVRAATTSDIVAKQAHSESGMGLGSSHSFGSASCCACFLTAHFSCQLISFKQVAEADEKRFSGDVVPFALRYKAACFNVLKAKMAV